MKVSSLSIFLVLILTALNVTASPWRTGAKRLFNASCTGIGTTIALSPSLAGLILLEPEEEESASEGFYPPRPATSYEKSKAKKYGLKNYHTLKIAESYDNSAMGGSAAGAGPDTTLYINPRDPYHKAPFIYAHEVSHLNNNDGENRPVLLIGCNLLSYCTFKKIKRKPTKIRSSFRKIPGGIGITIATAICYQYARTLQEARCDHDSMKYLSKIELLSAAQYYKNVHTAEIQNFEKNLVKLGHSSTTVEQASKYANFLLHSNILFPIITHHPPHIIRAQWFEQEAQKRTN